MAEDFTAAGYRALVEALLARGYEAIGYADADPDAAHLILRHDVDMSLQAAVALAEVERAMDVSAHYFVLLRTEMYNPHSAAGQAAVRRLAALGHRVGLHLDASLYEADLASLDRAAAEECAILEQIAGAPVDLISFHRPAPALLGHPARLAGRRHAYEPAFFADMGYCSDSRGGWHHGHPLDHEAVAEGRALQLLTHPIWWVGERAAPVQERLEGFAAARHRLLLDQLARNCSAFDADADAAAARVP